MSLLLLVLLVLLVVFSLSIYFNSNVPFCFFRENFIQTPYACRMYFLCISDAFLCTFEKYVYFALKGMHFSSKYILKKCIKNAYEMHKEYMRNAQEM